MQIEAEDRLLNSLVYCKSALSIDPNDGSANTAMLRTALKLAQYYKRQGKSEESKAYLDFISTSDSKNGIHSEMFVVTSNVEICKYHLKKGQIKAAKEHFNKTTVNNEYLFKRFPNLQSDYNKVAGQIEAVKFVKGIILSIDKEGKRVIIVNPLDRKHSYSAGIKDFTSLEFINDVKSVPVYFIPTEEKIENSVFFRAVAVTLDKPTDYE